MYRSPNPPLHLTASMQLESFNQQLTTLMTETAYHNTTSIIGLDSNINAHNCNSQHTHYEYFQSIHTSGYTQCINKSTRIQGNTNTLIDHILTNTTQQIQSGTLIADISDHFFTFIVAPFKQNRTKKQGIISRNLSTANVERFKTKLAESDWSGVLGTTDIDLSHSLFTDIFNRHYGSCFPITQTRFNKNKNKINEFMTQALLTSRQTKMQLHKQAIKHPTQDNITAYKAYRNTYNLLVRASRKRYYETSLKQAKNNPRRTWEILKDAMNTQNKTNKIEKLITNGITITDHKEMADSFGSFLLGLAGR